MCGVFVGAIILLATRLVLCNRSTTTKECPDIEGCPDGSHSEDLLQKTWFIIVLACGAVIVVALIMAGIIVVSCCRKGREKPDKPLPKPPSLSQVDESHTTPSSNRPSAPSPIGMTKVKSRPKEEEPAPPLKTNPNPAKTRANTIPTRPAPPPPIPPRSANTLQAHTRLGQTDIEDENRGDYENYSKLEENMDGWGEYLQEEKDINHLNAIFVHSLADKPTVNGAWTKGFKISKTHQQKIERCCLEESRPQTIDIAGSKFTLDKDNISQLSFHGSRRKKSGEGFGSEIVFAGVNKGYVIIVTADTAYRDQCEKTFYELQGHLMETTENDDSDLYINVEYRK